MALQRIKANGCEAWKWKKGAPLPKRLRIYSNYKHGSQTNRPKNQEKRTLLFKNSARIIKCHCQWSSSKNSKSRLISFLLRK